MAENSIIARRNKAATKAANANSIIARRTSNPNTQARKAEAAGGQWDQDLDPERMRYMQLEQEFNKLPMILGNKTQIGTAAKDIVRMATKGASFGLIDKLIGDAAETKDAATRSGLAGTVAEVGGMLASPATRAVGSVGTALRPVGKSLINSAKSLGITAGEGATLAGLESAISGGDVASDATTGAGLAAGAEATLKHAVPGLGKLVANLLAKVPPEALSDIFEVASTSKLGSDAIKSLQANKAPEGLLSEIQKLTSKLDGVPVTNIDEIENSLLDVVSKTATSSGHKALDATDSAIVNRLLDKAYGKEMNASTFNRPYFDDLVAYLEETKVGPAASKSTGGVLTKGVHDTIKKIGAEESPIFEKIMKLKDMRDKAYTAGKATSTLAPNTRAFDTARDVALATAFLSGSAALTNPLLLTAIIPTLMAASPKLVGKIARKSGNMKRQLKQVVPKGTGYGALGLVPGFKEER